LEIQIEIFGNRDLDLEILDRFRNLEGEQAGIILPLKKQAGDSFPFFFGPPGARTPALLTFKGIPLFCDAGLFI
jgi:hypothetical protein